MERKGNSFTYTLLIHSFVYSKREYYFDFFFGVAYVSEKRLSYQFELNFCPRRLTIYLFSCFRCDIIKSCTENFLIRLVSAANTFKS
jgi:hypothetical protein